MGHRTDSEHEMLVIPPQSSYISLPNSDDAGGADDEFDKSSERGCNGFRDVLRHFRLQVVTLIFDLFSGSRWNANAEYRKVAMRKSRTTAASHSLLHMIPLAGAITLLTFQLTGTWISHTDDYSTASQFAAKFHELAMQASLIEVLLCIIRTQLVDDLVPLGALSGAIQATQLSYLWSLDYLSVFKSHALKGWRRITLMVCIPTLIVLVSVVGPSSAVLMIPRPNSPRILGSVTDYVNASMETLFPSSINLAEMPMTDIAKINNNRMYGSIYDGVFSEPHDDDRIRSSGGVYRDPDGSVDVDRLLRTGEVLGGQLFRAVIPTRFAEQRLLAITGHIYPRQASSLLRLRNATVTTVAPHPVVDVNCISPMPSDLVGMNSTLLYWKDDGKSKSKLPELRKLLKNVTFVEDEQTTTSRSITFGSVFIPSPDPESHSSVMVSLQGYSSASHNTSTVNLLPWMMDQLNSDRPRMLFHATVCTISAYWITGEVQMVSNGASDLVKTAWSSLSVQSGRRPITLNFAGAEGWSNANLTLTGIHLAMDLAIALSEIPVHDDFEISRLGEVGSSKYTSFEYTNAEYGFGYGTRSTSVYLAMVVILLYCIITISYIIYTLITGSVSTAWNSGIELFTLALQSRKPDHLGHTSVGINSMKTFAEGVGVRVNKNNELEIVFANDRDFGTGALTKIVRNKEY